MDEKKEGLLRILCEQTGRKFRVLPSTGMSKLLKTFELDEIELALSFLVKDAWHAPKIKELSSEYLLRPTTIDRWLTIADKTPKINKFNDEPLIQF